MNDQEKLPVITETALPNVEDESNSSDLSNNTFTNPAHLYSLCCNTTDTNRNNMKPLEILKEEIRLEYGA